MGPRTEAHSAAKLSDFRHPWTNLPIMFTCPRTGEEASLPLQLSNEFCASLSWLPANEPGTWFAHWEPFVSVLGSY